VSAAARAFETWGQTTPADRSLALLKLADALESHGDEIAELEAPQRRQAAPGRQGDEIPFMVDNLRFFAGAARLMEGRPPASTWRATPR